MSLFRLKGESFALSISVFLSLSMVCIPLFLHSKEFKVDENGKITRLRKECASPSCGGGVFMASHQNRYYCGKCHQTLVMQDPKEKSAGKKV